MATRVRRIQVAALLVSSSGVSALVAVPNTLGPLTRAADSPRFCVRERDY